jgi:hypothetical protein
MPGSTGSPYKKYNPGGGKVSTESTRLSWQIPGIERRLGAFFAAAPQKTGLSAPIPRPLRGRGIPLLSLAL